MPEKPTKRERKDEAKKRRLEEMKRRQRHARMRKFYTWGTVALVLAIIAGLIVWNTIKTANTKNKAKNLAAAAGCELPGFHKSEGQKHILPTDPRVSYGTNPPTSGSHYNGNAGNGMFAPTATGVYPVAIQDEVQVHNLEHGHIIFQYQPGAITDSVLNGLIAIWRKNKTLVIVAPRPSMPYKLAFTAWTELQGCASPNDKSIAAAQLFFDRFHDSAPEHIAGTSLPEPSASPSASPAASPSPSPTGSGKATAPALVTPKPTASKT